MAKKIFWNLLLLSVCALPAFPQQYFVSGLLRDAFTGENLDSVRVCFMSRDSVEQETFTVNTFGKWGFTETLKAPGTYIIRFSKEGYEDAFKLVDFKYRKNRITSGSFGEIRMHKKSNLENRYLKEAVVSATKIKMVMKGDTVVFNADAFQLREGSMLDRLMTQLPGMAIHPGGELIYNGKKVSSLLVNGEDFFRGSPRVALENLPAYMVDKVKVYEQGPDAGRPDAMLDARSLAAEKPLVVDVNLKKKYNVGWLLNAGLGGGSGKHYSGKAFALRFTPQSRLAFMGYSNNVYGNSYYDASGNWQSPGGAGRQKTHELTSDYLLNDRDKNFKVNNMLSFKWKEEDEEEYSSTTRYLGSMDIHGTGRQRDGNRQWYLRDFATIKLTPTKSENRFEMTIRPEVYYADYRNSSFSQSAEYSRELADRYRGETLDSLFSAGNAAHYRRNLLSSLQQAQRNEGHDFYAQGKMDGSYVLPCRDYFSFNLGGRYDRARNRNLFEAFQAGGTLPQNRFSNSPQYGYDIEGGLDYHYRLKFEKLLFNLAPRYGYEKSFRSADRSYFRLEGTPWADAGFDRLASAGDALSQYIDLTNSFYSEEGIDRHEAGVQVYLYPELKNFRKNHHLDFYFPLRAEKKRYDYRRGAIDTLVHKSFVFFLPKLTYRFDSNNGTDQKKADLEHHFRLRYEISASTPASEYFTGFRDSSVPLVVREGSQRLRSTMKHETEAYVSRQRWRPNRDSFLSFMVRHTLWNDMICQAMTYDAATGIRTYRPENIDGNWGLVSQLLWRGSDSRKGWLNYSSETDFDFMHNVDYANLSDDVRPALSAVDRYVTRQTLKASFSRKHYYCAADVSAEWIHSASDRYGTLDAFNLSYGVSANIPLPLSFELSSSLKLYSRYGYSDDRFNDSRLIWSARLARSFAKGRLKAEVEAFDLLNQMSSYGYAINAQMQTETYRNVLRRYLMFNLTFHLNREPRN